MGCDGWKERAKNWRSWRHRVTWVGSRKGWQSGRNLPRNFIPMKIRFRRRLEADEEDVAIRIRRHAALKRGQKIMLLRILQVRLIHDDSHENIRNMNNNRIKNLPNLMQEMQQFSIRIKKRKEKFDVKKRYVPRMKAVAVLLAYTCSLMRSHNETA